MGQSADESAADRLQVVPADVVGAQHQRLSGENRPASRAQRLAALPHPTTQAAPGCTLLQGAHHQRHAARGVGKDRCHHGD